MRDARTVTNAACITDFRVRRRRSRSAFASAIGAALAAGARVSRRHRSRDIRAIQPDIELADDELDDVPRLEAAQTRKHVTDEASLRVPVGRRGKVVGPPGNPADRDPARQAAGEDLGGNRPDVPKPRATATEVVRADPHESLNGVDNDLALYLASPRTARRKDLTDEESHRRGHALLGNRCEVRVKDGPLLLTARGCPNGVGRPAPVKERIARTYRSFLGRRRLRAPDARDDLMGN
jgi:hypothetical protein